MRNTKQRDRVYNAVNGFGKHMSAEDVFSKVNEEEPKISLATVYRNLNLLADMDLITRVRKDEDQSFFYDGNPDRHYHIHCQNCGKYLDVPISYLEDLNIEVQAKTSADIKFHTIIFEGICQDCQKKSK